MNLFNDNDVASLSPKEEWKKKHGLVLLSTADGYEAFTLDVTGKGVTEDDALVDWAIKAGQSDWRV